jgi:Calcineurin-like phosphoesterase superfamily domain
LPSAPWQNSHDSLHWKRGKSTNLGLAKNRGPNFPNSQRRPRRSTIALFFSKLNHQQTGDIPPKKLVIIKGLKIGMIHGHQVIPWDNAEALQVIQREFDADIVISGHTHVSKTSFFEGKYYLNPGSITGASSALSEYLTNSP